MAIHFVVPGDKRYEIEQIVFDLNGTLANGGVIAPTTLELLGKLAQNVRLHLVTADTHGTAKQIQEHLGATLHTTLVQGADTAASKAALVHSLGAEKTITVGNGANDTLMFEAAALAIAIIGEEGCYARLLSKADLLVTHIDHALTMLLESNRIVATLRR